MLLLYPREILILDLEVNQTVGVIAIERTGIPFLQVSKVCIWHLPRWIRNERETKYIISSKFLFLF